MMHKPLYPLLVVSLLVSHAAIPCWAKPQPSPKPVGQKKTFSPVTREKKEETKDNAEKDTLQKKADSELPIHLGSEKNRDEPVYISSEKLDFDAVKRTFVYSGSVKVVQADITLTAQQMVGTYGADNKIETITARKDVVVVKQPDLRATSQAGVYQARTGVVTLTENPHLFQGGNDLAADKITIDLNTSKSSAEGQVRMKVIKAPNSGELVPN